MPDPYNNTSDEVCAQLGVSNVDFEYTEEDHELITSLKVIFSCVYRLELPKIMIFIIYINFVDDDENRYENLFLCSFRPILKCCLWKKLFLDDWDGGRNLLH